MGFSETIMWVVIILVAMYFFTPTLFDKTIDTAKDVFGSFADGEKETSKKDSNKDTQQLNQYNKTTEGKDYGKILGHMDCVMDSDCVFFFEIDGMVCNAANHCIDPN
jgi:hypothetical protein